MHLTRYSKLFQAIRHAVYIVCQLCLSVKKALDNVTVKLMSSPLYLHQTGLDGGTVQESQRTPDVCSILGRCIWSRLRK